MQNCHVPGWMGIGYPKSKVLISFIKLRDRMPFSKIWLRWISQICRIKICRKENGDLEILVKLTKNCKKWLASQITISKCLISTTVGFKKAQNLKITTKNCHFGDFWILKLWKKKNRKRSESALLSMNVNKLSRFFRICDFRILKHFGKKSSDGI